MRGTQEVRICSDMGPYENYTTPGTTYQEGYGVDSGLNAVITRASASSKKDFSSQVCPDNTYIVFKCNVDSGPGAIKHDKR